MNDEQTPALREAVENMANMREAYDNLSQATEAYNTGKTELAANINAKGVEASASETLPELAEKVTAIAQETYEINGGEMYAKQLFGSLETPNYWNLYEVLAQLLSDGRLVSYGGILLAEYYRGYDSLALAGAGAGGAYVVSDLDENGQFKMYTEDTTHVWATEFDGKGNRWVAYCFANEYHDFQITDTNTSPRSIFIGRKIGIVKCLANSRIAQIVVPDGNELNGFNTGTFDNSFESSFILRNIKNNDGFNPISGCSRCLFIDAIEEIVSFSCRINSGSVILKAPQITGNTFITAGGISINDLIMDAETIATTIGIPINGNFSATNVSFINNDSVTGGTYALFRSYNGLKRIYIAYKNNDRTKSANVSFYGNAPGTLVDCEIKSGWCKPLNVSSMTSLTATNIVNHILNKLGDNTGQSPLTITLGATNLAKLTAEEIAIATNKGFTLA